MEKNKTLQLVFCKFAVFIFSVNCKGNVKIMVVYKLNECGIVKQKCQTGNSSFYFANTLYTVKRNFKIYLRSE